MKKAKILLAVIIVLIFIGGYFSFGAHKFVSNLWYAYGVNQATIGCVVPVAIHYTTSLSPTVAIDYLPYRITTTDPNLCAYPAITSAGE